MNTLSPEQIADLSARNGHAPPAESTSATGAKRKGSALTAPAPPVGTPAGGLLNWGTAQLRLPSPIARVQRWGASGVSPVNLKLVDGRNVRFGEAADIANPQRLVQTVVLALGSSAPQLPTFTRADAQDVFSVIIRACAIVEKDDEVANARDWQDAMGRLFAEVHHGAYADAPARWEALRWLRGMPDFDATQNRLAFQDPRYAIPVLVWADGTKYVRVEDVERHVRGVLGQRLAVQQIRARMLEAGWEHRRAEARRPGAGGLRGDEDRVRVSVFVIRAASDDAPPNGVSPSSPLLDPRACTPAHASTSWGSLGTSGETPMNADDSKAGDNKEAGDTRGGAA